MIVQPIIMGLYFQCVRTRRLLQQMLIHLTTRMRAPEKYSLLHSLATHAGTLCQIICSNTPVSPVHYECLAIALDCLQQGITSLKVGELHQESLRELQLEMESMLNSNLTREFPLVVSTVLRLTSTIELCAKWAIWRNKIVYMQNRGDNFNLRSSSCT